MDVHIVMGSFVTMEVCIGGVKYDMKPITHYAFLMEELIDNEEDIAVLRDVEVI